MKPLLLALALALPSHSLAAGGVKFKAASGGMAFPTTKGYGQSIITNLDSSNLSSGKTVGLAGVLKTVNVNDEASLSILNPVAHALWRIARQSPEMFPGLEQVELAEEDRGELVRVRNQKNRAIQAGDHDKAGELRAYETQILARLGQEAVGAQVGKLLGTLEKGTRDRLLAQALQEAASELEQAASEVSGGVEAFVKKHPDASAVSSQEFGELKASAFALERFSSVYGAYLSQAAQARVKSAYAAALAKRDALEKENVALRIASNEEKLAGYKAKAKTGGFADWANQTTAGQKLAENLEPSFSVLQQREIEILTPDLLGDDEPKAFAALGKLEALLESIRTDEQRKAALDRFLRVVQKTADDGRRERALAGIVKLSEGGVETAERARAGLLAQIDALQARKARRDIAVAGIERETQRVLDAGVALESEIARLEKALADVSEALKKAGVPEPRQGLSARWAAAERGAGISRIAWAAAVWADIYAKNPWFLALALVASVSFAGYQLSLLRLDEELPARPGEERRALPTYLASAIGAVMFTVGLAISGFFGAAALEVGFLGLVIAAAGGLVWLLARLKV